MGGVDRRTNVHSVLPALLGGALIGAAASWLWFANGRVAGVSGILRGALLDAGRRTQSVLFLVGLALAGVLGSVVGAPSVRVTQPAPFLLAAGLLVGFGTRVGGGCTSGHGVCGLSRFSVRSLVATLTFMTTGAATVFVLGHVLPGWRPR
jgi:uncharacterized membrane protein YedE/YeeE